jgi:hypothetical protein
VIPPDLAATQISRAAPWRLTMIFEPFPNSISITPPGLVSKSKSATPLIEAASSAASMRASSASAAAMNSRSSIAPCLQLCKTADRIPNVAGSARRIYLRLQFPAR